MSKLILPKASTTVRGAGTPGAGEILFDSDTKRAFIGDGATQGGLELSIRDASGAFVYGVDRDMTLSSPSCQRVILNADGATYTNVASFTRMPVHNLKRCVMDNLATRHINYYLNSANSALKADGTAAVLDGTDGDVMVEFPVAHYRIDHYTDDNSHAHTVKLISDRPFPGSAPFPAFYVSNGGATLQKQYMGAFKGSVYSNKLRSIVASGVKPTVSKTRAQFRTAAVANGGTGVNFLLKVWLGWLVEIEFASTDTQTSISTGLSYLTSYDPAYLRTCGRTVSMGNGTGEIISDAEGADADLEGHWASGASKVVACSYRGVEDPWGACYEFDDGIQKYQDDVAGDYTKSGYTFTTDTSKYTLLDTDQGYGPANTPFPAAGNTGAATAWVSQAWPKAGGFIKLYDPLTYFPTDVTGSSSTYLCDQIFNNANAGARVVTRCLNAACREYVGAFALGLTENLNSSTSGTAGRLAC